MTINAYFIYQSPIMYIIRYVCMYSTKVGRDCLFYHYLLDITEMRDGLRGSVDKMNKGGVIIHTRPLW